MNPFSPASLTCDSVFSKLDKKQQKQHTKVSAEARGIKGRKKKRKKKLDLSKQQLSVQSIQIKSDLVKARAFIFNYEAHI